MKKIAFTLLFVFGSIIISCVGEQCPPVQPYFKINSISSENLKFVNEGTNPWILVAENDTVQWSVYFVRVSFNTDYIASTPNNNSIFSGSSLFALSCVEPGYQGSKVGVKNVHVITLIDYDSLHIANDTIDSIVLLNNWTYLIEDYSNFYSISDYVENNKESIQNQYFELKLTSPPSNTFQNMKLQIVYELENGDMFLTETEEVILIK